MRAPRTTIQLLALMLATCLFSGCSLKKTAAGSGLHIKIKAPTPAKVLAKSLSKMFSVLSTEPSGAVTNLSHLGCFAVTASGGALGGNDVCNGNITIGDFDGAYNSIDSDFQFGALAGDNITFAAYGMPGTDCQDFDYSANDDTSDSVSIFKLGEVTVEISDTDQPDVEIPVDVSGTSSFTCGGGYFQFFADDFASYGDGSFPSNSYWTPGGTVNILTQAIDASSLGAGPFYILSNNGLNRSLSSIRISMDVTYKGISSGSPYVNLGVAKNVSGTTGFGCSFTYASGAPDTITASIGRFSSGLGTFGTTDATGSSSKTPASHRLVCQLVENGSGGIGVTARIFDLSNEAQVGSDVSFTETDDTTATVAVMSGDSNTRHFNSGTAFDSITIEQARDAQP